ncbi:MAG: rRNA maturation RNase YbeY [Bacteroidota bacterium]
MDFPIIEESEEDQQINFFFEDVTFTLPDEDLLSGWLLGAAQTEGHGVSEINYIFCSDEHLRKINIEFLDHDYYTDVITFPYDSHHIHGDVFISYDRVRENAATAGVTFERELSRVMVHGLLHLAGYDDKSPDDKVKMTGREDFYLSSCPVA